MKSLLLGILFILFIGIGGFMYRNAIEHRPPPTACTLEAKVCPDGTAVGRAGPACTFPACPPPNVAYTDVNIAFVVPEGAEFMLGDDQTIVAYRLNDDATARIIIRRYPIAASSTALETIQLTAIGGSSGMPVPQRLFSSIKIGERTFTVVSIERFEAVINTAYYLARSSDVLRFDAVDRDVLSWMEPNLDISELPAHSAIMGLLTTLQGE